MVNQKLLEVITGDIKKIREISLIFYFLQVSKLIIYDSTAFFESFIKLIREK